jgi:hypothetical protein
VGPAVTGVQKVKVSGFKSTFSKTGKTEKKRNEMKDNFIGRRSRAGAGDRVTRDRCYDFKNIFAEKFSEKNGVFDSKQS